MAEQLYIRVRGRVMGPYDSDKLQALVKRGQLGRMHEVSEDGVTWVRATSFPELFVSGGTNGSVATANQVKPQSSGVVDFDVESEYPVTTAAPTSPQVSGQQVWYYTSSGGQAGPVDFATLQRMVANGQFAAGDMVWTDGMSQWSPPSLVPGLTPTSAQSTFAQSALSPENLARGDGEKAEPKVSADVCRSLSGSRPWVLFIAILVFIYAALSLIGGGVMLIQGARLQSTTTVASGVFAILFSILEAIGAFFLLLQSNRIGLLKHTRSDEHLVAVLEAARIFWVYVGILLIVLLAFATVVGVWILAIGGTF